MNIFKAKKAAKDRYMTLNRTALVCMAVVIAEALALVVLVICVATLSHRQKVIPWIVEVDKHNFVVSSGAAELTTLRDPRVIISHLSRFIEAYKSVTADPTAQRWLLSKLVYSSLAANSSAANTANQYYRQHDPFKRLSDNETVAVDVRVILPSGNDTWRAEWTETIYKDGVVSRKENWSGLFTISVSPSVDVDRIKDNPLGIYITDFTVSRNYMINN